MLIMLLRILDDLIEDGMTTLAATDTGVIVRLRYTEAGQLMEVEAYDPRSAESQEIELPLDVVAAIETVERDRQPWSCSLVTEPESDEVDETEWEPGNPEQGDRQVSALERLRERIADHENPISPMELVAAAKAGTIRIV